jgi:hypothetical protein
VTEAWILRAADRLQDDLDPDCMRLAEALRAWAAQRHLGLTLEVALGLVEPVAAEAREAERNRLIGDLARRFPGGPYAKADAIAPHASRFASDVWPAHRHLGELPAGRSDRDRILFAIHRTGAPWPLSRRQLGKIVHSTLESAQTPEATSGHLHGVPNGCHSKVPRRRRSTLR